MLLVVSIKNQKVHVYDAEWRNRVVSRVDRPAGIRHADRRVFHSGKERLPPKQYLFRRSNAVQQRITWSGIALHAGVVPGFRASHGCIRLPYSFSKKLYDITKLGSRVIVTADDAEPIAFNQSETFHAAAVRRRERDEAGHTERAAARSERSGGRCYDFGRSSMCRDSSVFRRHSSGRSPRCRAIRSAVRQRGSKPTRSCRRKSTRLQAALKAADSARVAATDKAKTTAKDFDAANDQLNAARSAIEPVRAAVKAAEKKQQDAINAFEDYMSGDSTHDAQIDIPGRRQIGRRRESRKPNSKTAVLEFDNETDKARAQAAKSEMSFAEVQASFSAAQSARDTASKASVRPRSILRSAQTSLIDTNKEVVRRAKPISVLVSLRAQRIYIRQGVEPSSRRRSRSRLCPARSERMSSRPCATAAIPIRSNGNWSALRRRRRVRLSTRSRKSENGIAIFRRLADSTCRWQRQHSTHSRFPTIYLRRSPSSRVPAASLIVSDRELPLNENGSGTEFVVLTR